MATVSELRKKVADTINAWIGLKRSDRSHKPIIDLYNSHKPLARGYAVTYDDAYCATTVSAAFIKCGLTDIAPTECGCGKMIELYQKLGRWEENDAYRPSVGDVVFYDWEDGANYASTDNKGAADHVGIVTAVNGTTLTITEGNMGGGKVGTRQLAVNGRYIRGYGLPDYASKATADAPSKPDTPAPQPVTPTALKYKVGDIVKLNGSKHYISSDASNAKTCKPGTAKVTAVFAKGKHPYHLIAEKGGGSTVYGWVDAADIEGAVQSAPATPATFSVGDKVKVSGSVYCYGNGTGGSANRNGKTMYVVGLVSSKTYKYYIGLADKSGGVRIGWAEPSQLTHC